MAGRRSETVPPVTSLAVPAGYGLGLGQWGETAMILWYPGISGSAVPRI